MNKDLNSNEQIILAKEVIYSKYYNIKLPLRFYFQTLSCLWVSVLSALFAYKILDWGLIGIIAVIFGANYTYYLYSYSERRGEENKTKLALFFHKFNCLVLQLLKERNGR
ncbi:hypothetical protein [Campylobacter sp. RM12651]|uniref:hypothetical protein n=1 Tax=Campylobacter sp. RM12651 TaxID=1660079 RepID=UPI001EFC1058|nr:hypothetical protein [Campylobacter sp. RM12651]ULO04485.1 hypothetical protein AVBRAN_a0003 [Campylobacter sp. RM12651]